MPPHAPLVSPCSLLGSIITARSETLCHRLPPRSDCAPPAPRPQSGALVLRHLPRRHRWDRGFHRLPAAHPPHLPRPLPDPAQRSEACGKWQSLGAGREMSRGQAGGGRCQEGHWGLARPRGVFEGEAGVITEHRDPAGKPSLLVITLMDSTVRLRQPSLPGSSASRVSCLRPRTGRRPTLPPISSRTRFLSFPCPLVFWPLVPTPSLFSPLLPCLLSPLSPLPAGLHEPTRPQGHLTCSIAHSETQPFPCHHLRCVHTHTHMHVHTCTYTCTHRHMCTHAYTYTSIHMHTHSFAYLIDEVLIKGRIH